MVLLFTFFLSLLSKEALTSPTGATHGILLSGGDGSGAQKSVEVYVPSTGMSCMLPPMPDARVYHSMNGLVVCGGTYVRDSCVSMVSGQWETSHALESQRNSHVSWVVGEELLLMGGGNLPTTSEVLPLAGGDGSSAWAMKYDTRNACAMPDLTSESVIVTGGYKTRSTVTRYDRQGFVEDLPSLVVGRSKHGCGSYLREDGSQVLLVAGGDNFGFINNHEASTEVLTPDSASWTLAKPLPRGLIGIRGVTVAGRVYMTGGYTEDNDVVDDIYGWVDAELGWEETGKMSLARGIHAATTIDLNSQEMEFCT